MKKLSFLALILIAVSCSKNEPATVNQPPTVDFSYSGANMPAPATVAFTSTTTNTTSYLWDFGDNGTSTAANPNHTYINGGVYTVKLTAKGTSGSTSITKTVNIGVALTKVKITNISVTGMPFTSSNGSGWDPLDGPDVYFKITDIASTVLFNSTSSSRKNNITINSLPISWSLTNPFETTNFSDLRFIELWDYDTLDPDDYIGYAGFDFSSYNSSSNPYPSSITSTNAGITVTLDLIWY